jgi:hypothetical protein
LFDGIRIGAEQPCAVILDQRLYDGRRITVRHFARGIIRVECQRMTTAAMLSHRNWQHSRTARLRNVTFGALDDSPAVGRNDSRLINMHSMIETQVCVIGSLFRSEVRMCIKKIGDSLEGNVIGKFAMAVGAQSLVLLYEFGWFVVLEMAGGAANFPKDISGW